MTTEDTLRDAFAQALTCTYVCGRVWEAWSVGTMTQDDFSPAAECDEVLDELTAVALAALTLAQQERDELRAALERLMRHFPTDADMAEAGWSGDEINRACAAHDAAGAALTPKATQQETKS